MIALNFEYILKNLFNFTLIQLILSFFVRVFEIVINIYSGLLSNSIVLKLETYLRAKGFRRGCYLIFKIFSVLLIIIFNHVELFLSLFVLNDADVLSDPFIEVTPVC